MDSVAEFGIKRFECGIKGLKKSPKTATVMVTGMGLSILDATDKPVTTLLYQMLGGWNVTKGGLEIVRKGDRPVILKTPDVVELKAEMDKASVFLKTKAAPSAAPAPTPGLPCAPLIISTVCRSHQNCKWCDRFLISGAP